jgi:PAS domain S-box-containing protein
MVKSMEATRSAPNVRAETLGRCELVALCPHPILVVTSDNRIDLANDAARRSLGHSACAPGELLENLVYFDDRQQFRAAATLFDAVGGFKGALRFLRSDGEARIGDATWFRLGSGEPHSAMMIVDAHETRQLLADLFRRVDRFEAAASASNEGWWEWEVGHATAKFSRRFRAILGIVADAEDQPIEEWYCRIEPADRLDFMRRLQDVAEGRAPIFRSEHRVKRDDRWRTVAVSATVLLGTDGRPQRIAGTVSDVTHERQSQEEQTRLRRLFEHSLDGMMIVDAEGRGVEVNEVGRTLCGLTSGLRVSQLVLSEAFDEEANRAFAKGLQSARAGLSWNKDVFARPPGKDAPVELRVAIFPIERDASGAATMLGVVLQDVTLQKKAQRSDLEHRESLAHVLRLGTMGEMAGGVAHELNQPLASIVNYLEGSLLLLRKGRLEPEALADVLQRAAHQAHLAGGIIARMRQFIRKKQPQFTPVGPKRLVTESIAFIEPHARQLGVKLEVDVDADLPSVFVDPIQIEQVLMNLAANAKDELLKVDASGRRILFRVRADGEWVVFSVCDTGPGVPAELRRTIFEPFFSTKPKSTSLGLGLSISRSLVESYGGALWLDDPEGEYSSVFRFSLPLQPTSPAPSDSVV